MSSTLPKVTGEINTAYKGAELLQRSRWGDVEDGLDLFGCRFETISGYDVSHPLNLLDTPSILRGIDSVAIVFEAR